MLDDIHAALTFATRRSDWPRTALLGSLLLAAPGGLVSSVLLAGFAARVLRGDRDDPIPTFDDPGGLAADGCRLAAVVAAYYALPAVLVLVGVRRSGLLGVGTLAGDLSLVARRPYWTSVASPVGLGGPSLDPLAAAALAAGALLALPAGYLGAVAAARVARTGRAAAGFDAAVLATARRGRTLAAWAVGVLVVVAGRVVAAVAGGLPVVGWAVAAAVGFHASVTATRLWSLWLDRPATPTSQPSQGDVSVGD